MCFSKNCSDSLVNALQFCTPFLLHFKGLDCIFYYFKSIYFEFMCIALMSAH